MYSNTVLDASNLPIDVIHLLFDQAASLDPPRRDYGSDPSSNRYLLGWISLTHVCQKWRHAGLRMHLLWASIVTTFPDPLIADELLARAGTCPFTVDTGAHLLSGVVGDPLLAWTSTNSARIGVLKFPSWKFYNAVQNGGKKPLPLLHTIHFEDLIDEQRYDPLQTLQLRAPKLRSATLTDTIISPVSACFLRELDLSIFHRTWVSPERSLSAIHGFLRCCTQLESLNLKEPSLSTHGGEYHARDVQLNKLKSATLSVNSEQTAWDLWRPVIAPDDIVLKIICKERDPASSRSTPLLLELCATHLRFEHHDAVEFVDCDMTVYRSSSDRNTSSCTLISRQHGLATLLDTFPAFVRRENIRALSLISATLGTDQINDVFLALACALPNVTNLSLKGMNHWPASLYIRALGRRTPAPVFPALEILRVSDIDLKGVSRHPSRSLTQYWWDRVITALQARSDANDVPLLRSLVLEGTWTYGQNWNVVENEEELRECRARGLVQVINDCRTFVQMTAGRHWPMDVACYK